MGDGADDDLPGGPQDGWLVCPNCSVSVEFVNCHTVCPRCHVIVESCSDGGRLPERLVGQPSVPL